MRRAEHSPGIIPGSANLIPGCTGVNSRFAVLREFAGKGLICLTVFTAKRRLSGENRRNSRLGGKNLEFCPRPAEPAVAQLPDNGADLGCPGPIVPLVANRGVQPFASDGLPGTGPKPAARYLHGLATIKLGPLLYYLNEPEH